MVSTRNEPSVASVLTYASFPIHYTYSENPKPKQKLGSVIIVSQHSAHM